MKEILLTSEAFVKNVTAISDNLAGKYLLPAIRDAQEIHLKGIVGSCLLEKMKEMMKGDKFKGDFNKDFNKDFATTEGGNQKYKDLIDRCQYYLAYMSIVEVLDRVALKVTNFGVVKTNDENVQQASQEEISQKQARYLSKADAQAYELQGWLLRHRSEFPELSGCDCDRIHSNLYSAASCGIFLGGERGKGGWR